MRRALGGRLFRAGSASAQPQDCRRRSPCAPKQGVEEVNPNGTMAQQGVADVIGSTSSSLPGAFNHRKYEGSVGALIREEKRRSKDYAVLSTLKPQPRYE